MKLASNILRVLAVVVAVVTIAAFFFSFVEVAGATGTTVMNGLECALGTDLSETFGSGMTTFKSTWILGSLVLTVATAVLMIVGLFSKKTGWNGMAVITGLLNSILLIVFAANGASAYIDVRPVTGVALSYELGMILAVIFGIATLVLCVAAILVKDAVDCKESGNLTIPKKVLKFLREYKSELKKVVWPSPRGVIKNTLVVLAVCAFALLLIWLVDLGLGELFDLCFKAN